LLIADEPTSALDLLTQREVLSLLERLNREMGTAILCISHDLLALASFCHRVVNLHEGSAADCGPPGHVFTRPTHPYTRKLVEELQRCSAHFGSLSLPGALEPAEVAALKPLRRP
jgi:ABC-type dipeptide/oligopeptide/nickel transport system ATPase component